ncbi:hypothetical protein SLEP1_g12455 [Rubroshorea leprosula]|uniref:Uncharacterized protein n=1 Tax=Rubroshorea leprosula TaxID=152421 RepID=A0AAV5IM12_9ROSI|nr:hypothetical protein SLEP1_g12455 [Rubroshorea leprosula]
MTEVKDKSKDSCSSSCMAATVAPIIVDLSIGVSTPKDPPRGFAGQSGLQIRTEERHLVWRNYIWCRLWESELKAPLFLLSWLKLGRFELETHLSLLDEVSESQGQSHIAPVQQPLHDDATRRLDSLEKLVAEQRGAPPPHHAADSIPHPLNTNITLEPYLAGFRIPQLETYDEMKDLDDHLHAFYSCMQAQNASDALMCKIFPSTLRGNARTWYYSLPPRSINSYAEMASAFATKFSSRRLIRKTTFELMRVRELNSHDLSENKGQPQGLRNPPNRQGVGYQQTPPPLPPPARIIHMITGGLEVGGLSSKQRKLYVRERVLVDTGSAPNIMYFHCFESLGLDPALLQRYDGPIYGFNNQPVPVEGILTMNVAFGRGRSYVTPSVRFLVVKMASSFNVVIGRPTLTEIRAVVSQSHLCMKFPTPIGIATLRGNQEIPDNRQVMSVEIVDNRPKDETRAAPVEDVEEVQIDDRDPTKKTQIGTRLSLGERTELIAFLRANKDVFAWTSVDMPGIPTSRLTVIKEEVEKLLQVGFVRRVDYCEWVANPVLVKKVNGKWRMCIDYTNLNHACPKDCYPMPNIDKLVEAASGNKRLSLLDAYSGYHQVPMAPEDEEKTSFYADDEIYCYVMMPFGLKNASTTYQKMVTIVFRAQIGRNLEVYVDDIVVKSLKVGDHLIDLEETFTNLKKNRMRLNLAKCIFGMESEKFLSFVVSRRGIEVNSEKIKAVAEMEPSKLVKDIQRLTGRVAAFHRFISKSVDKCLPFFKIMRSAGQKDESVELGEFEITFQQRLAIRAQALVDFIVECTPCHEISSPEPNDWTFYVDGASSSKGSGAGALLLGPDGYRSEHALKFNFDATNNMVEYEALLLDLQLALELKISAIQVYSDSQLVVNQINSICEVVDPVMVKYVTLVAELKCKFQKFCLSKIPRAENEQVDSLSKFASNSSLRSRSVFVEVLDAPSFMKPREAMKLRKKASWYTLVDGVLYKRSFSLSLLRCLNPYKAEYALREVHKGVCGSHVGLFMKGVGGVTHLIVGVDYFTKWVKAWALSSLTSRKVEDFVFSSISCRYGIPNQIVADNGTQFNCSSFRDFCSSPGIKLQFTLVYHPEPNGMVKHPIIWPLVPKQSFEIGVPTFRVTHFDEGRNGQLLRENLDLLDEVREEARLRTLVYKQKIANFYNKQVLPRTFKVRDLVLRKAGLTGFETRFGKLAPNWEGPYIIAEVPHPGVYILQDSEDKRVPRVWNANNLKKFYP